ncbi:MAG TPA: hypothetical protein VLG49_00350 [Rhabdochlamydiaceae bacterium]|nr:hypothetical protein [Rhabdochlamydiaceae bacterium]
MKKLIAYILFLFLCFRADAKIYNFTNDPVDVVIPCTDKDLDTLNLCIEGIRNNCSQVRRIIVISDRPLTDKAEWFDEKQFPFDKTSVAYYLLGCNEQKANEYLSAPKPRVGWYIQQLYKLYASYVIPGISTNVLHLDSDTIFLNPVSFVDPSGGGLYNPGTEYHIPYFDHINKVLPGLTRTYREYSGISHHMLLQKDALDELFQLVESHHNLDLWKVYCLCVDQKDLFLSGAASDELYFNFVFPRTNQVKLRFLKWENISSLRNIFRYQRAGYHYVSCHSYSRS